MPRDPEDTLSLADLSHWSEPGTHLAVLGHPVKHSLSPRMHNAALAEMAAATPALATWRYWKIDVDPEALGAALALLHAKGFLGLNLTVPHKILALDLIAEVDAKARDIGAVNTLCRTPTGFAGHNTDGAGLAAGIAADLGLSLQDRDVILLGAGGAARSAAVQCLRERCRSLWIGNRSRESLDELLTRVRPLAGTIPLHDFLLAAPPAELPPGGVLINSTSAGLRLEDTAPIDLRRWPRPASLYDMIYNPPQTPLLRDAAAMGIPCANGLSMLVHQGARALELWTGAAVPVATMQRAAALTLRP